MSSSTLDSSQPASSPRSSPTEALWAHVLRQNKLGPPPRNFDVPPPPLAPLDRNATSTRILLYDTQARLEQFSTRADGMLKSMHDASQQLKTIGMLFEKDRDTLTNDMIDLVNRSQTEIQKAVGRPCQENHALAFHDKLELRVEGLNQRLDALHMFNQTHYQAIETQSQTLKSIQDQQNALLAAILPLLPLVQTVPSQIDSLKACIQEVGTNVSSSITAFQKDLLLVSSTHSRPLSRTPTRKRRLSTLLTEDSSALQPINCSNPSKKIRVDTSISSGPTPAVDAAPDRSNDSKGATGEAFGVSLQTQDIATPENRTWKLNSEVASYHSALAPPRPGAVRGLGNAALSLRTPPPTSRTSTPQQQIGSLRIPDVPADRGDSERRLVSATTFSQHTSPPNLTSIPSSRMLTPAAIQTMNTVIFSGVLAQGDTAARTTPIYRNPSRQTDNTNRILHHRPPASGTSPVRTQLNSSASIMNNHACQQRGPIAASNRRMTMSMGPAFTPGNKLRDRRSPPVCTSSASELSPRVHMVQREGRRFIPLDDDDDDEEEDKQ